MRATFSPCRTWRYTLTREIAQAAVVNRPPVRRTVAFIGLNPSTADEMNDDPTIRRCVAFARAWGFDQMTMLNLFAYRATDPKVLQRWGGLGANVVGPQNDHFLARVAAGADLVVAAWGTHGTLAGRDQAVRKMLSQIKPLHYLRLTKDGHPSHPLYLPGNLTPQPWSAGLLGQIEACRREVAQWPAGMVQEQSAPAWMTNHATDL